MWGEEGVGEGGRGEGGATARTFPTTPAHGSFSLIREEPSQYASEPSTNHPDWFLFSSVNLPTFTQLTLWRVVAHVWETRKFPRMGFIRLAVCTVHDCAVVSWKR